MRKRFLPGILVFFVFSACGKMPSESSSPDEIVASLTGELRRGPGDVDNSQDFLALDAGGPYGAKVGVPIELNAEFGIAAQVETVTDLKQIGLALLTYHDVFLRLPPAYLTDDGGAPMLSWRVLILPFLGAQDLYDRFDLSKPWNDPVNQGLLREMPDVFRAPGQSPTEMFTGYSGSFGPDQIFQDGGGMSDGIRLTQVTDGTSNTFAVGPVGSRVRIPWTAPLDVAVNDQPSFGNPDGFDAPGRVATSMVFIDGSVRALLDDTSVADVLAMSTIAGGEVVAPSNHELTLEAAWDLDDDGVFESPGASVLFSANKSGTYPVRVQVIDGFGGVRTNATVVVVR